MTDKYKVFMVDVPIETQKPLIHVNSPYVQLLDTNEEVKHVYEFTANPTLIEPLYVDFPDRQKKFRKPQMQSPKKKKRKKAQNGKKRK